MSELIMSGHMPAGKTHELLVNRIKKKYGAKSGNFYKALSDSDEFFDDWDLPRYSPDAFSIEMTDNELCQAIVRVWEVEVTHPLSQRQLDVISMIHFECNPNFELKLFIVDRYGNENEMEIMGSFLNSSTYLVPKHEVAHV